MTPTEQLEERRVIISTRLGILCEDREPMPEQMTISTLEANQWQERYRREHGEVVQQEIPLTLSR